MKKRLDGNIIARLVSRGKGNEEESDQAGQKSQTVRKTGRMNNLL